MDKERKKQLFSDAKAWTRALEIEAQSDVGGSEAFKFDASSKKPFFGIDTPPPYPSGKWHLGAAAQYSQIDAIARTARMLGNKVLFPVGIDRNGLPVEKYTEKKYNIRMRNTDRAEFIKLCRGALDELEKEMIDILKSLSFSADFNNIYRTDSEEYRKLTQTTFLRHWKEGRVYRGNRPTNYCVDCGTTIADAEIEYREIPTKLVHFSFDIKNSGEKITIASTRPELLAACRAIIVNPDDGRYKTLVGKSAVVPVYGQDVPIVSHSSAKQEFGSGAVMVCSYGDYNDVLLFKELGLKETVLINEKGKMTDAAGELASMSVSVARAEIINRLQKDGKILKIEQISHRTPTCDRSKNPIEIIPMDEYYLRTDDLKKEAERMADELVFIPPRHRQLLLNWINVAADWPVSRRRFYGTEIPLWYCKKCGETYVPPGGRYYQPWREDPPECASCGKCGSKEFTGDVRTFDTWMDSSISALFVTKYISDEKFHSLTYPLTMRVQGIDIVRTWLYYSLIRCFDLEKRAPWEKVWIGGMGLDEHGEKMSKSKGNVVDPVEIISKHGSDAFRFWASSEASPGSNFLFSEQKIMGAQKFLTKLWNVAKFIKEFHVDYRELSEEKLFPTDKWILSELSVLIKEAVSAYSEFNFFVSTNKIREFIWNVFAPHYLEMAKGRAYGSGFSDEERTSAIYTTNRVLRSVLLLLAPICPAITDSIWVSLYSDSTIHSEEFPQAPEPSTATAVTAELMEFNEKVWAEKRSKGKSLKEGVSVSIPGALKPFEKDLKVMHNLV